MLPFPFVTSFIGYFSRVPFQSLIHVHHKNEKERKARRNKETTRGVNRKHEK
jgi:hypothetical protein